MSAGKYSPAIIVAAYNRVNSLERLLHSLEQAVYPEIQITLVISIDKGDNADVIKLAERFNWKYGEKRILKQDTHLGLKEHILLCGDLTAEYGSIILLEDDLFVSKFFYDYANKSLNFYTDDARIAGISLYSYDISENGFNPFVPVDDGADVYFMQVASSWGQAWTNSQWKAFREWFRQHPEITSKELPPAYLLNWHENSWKKHFIRYLHFNDKFFVFPLHSLTTNFEEPGATASTKGLYQVPVLEAHREYNLRSLNDSKSLYNASFEMRADCLKKWCPFLQAFDFTVDLYGTLPLANCKTPYLLTIKQAKDEVFSFAQEMFPPVLNVINDLRGEQIRLVKKENVISEKVAADSNYYKLKPVSEIIFQNELVERVEKVYANYSEKIDALHKTYNEKTEALNSEIRQMHENYHAQISKLHDDYAVKIKSAVEESLKDYQFKLDSPQFAIVTIVNPENFESAIRSAKSVMEQDYPRVVHKLILIGKGDGLNLAELKFSPKLLLVTCDNIADALNIAETHFNNTESDYHCWLEAGTVLLPKALLTVRDIFKRFAEVNWLKGLPVLLGEKGEYIPTANGIDFRWDKSKFQNTSLAEIGNKISPAVFWKKHLWEKVGGQFNNGFEHLADIELYNRMFSKDQLYIVMANLVAANGNYSPSQQALQEFDKLNSGFQKPRTKQRLFSSLGLPFFSRDIPVFRAIHKSQHSYPPLIRFDFNSQSFYLSDY